MAELVDLDLRPAEVPPARAVTEADWLFDDVLAQLRDTIVPRVSDPLALQRTKGVARILKYLAEIQRDGPFFEAAELDDITAALGNRPASIDDGRRAIAAAVRDGTFAPRDYLQYLWNRIARENELLRPASGVMADRHWPPLH